MRAVRGPDGRPYLLEEASEHRRVYDPREGAYGDVPVEDLDPVEDDPLAVLGRAAIEAAGPLPVAGDAAAGLLVDLETGPRSVRAMLDSYGRCESDLHGLLAELTAAGLIAETTVAGRRGYELSERGDATLRRD